MLLCPFLGEGSPTKIGYRKTGSFILTSLLEDLATSLETNQEHLVDMAYKAAMSHEDGPFSRNALEHGMRHRGGKPETRRGRYIRRVPSPPTPSLSDFPFGCGVTPNGIPFRGRCTTHVRTYFGDWDVH